MSIQLNKGFILRKIGPQYMAVPYGEAATRAGGMLSLSESGYRLWQAMEAGVCEEEGLIDLLTDTYEVSRAVAAADVRAFLSYLAEHGAVAI